MHTHTRTVSPAAVEIAPNTLDESITLKRIVMSQFHVLELPDQRFHRKTCCLLLFLVTCLFVVCLFVIILTFIVELHWSADHVLILFICFFACRLHFVYQSHCTHFRTDKCSQCFATCRRVCIFCLYCLAHEES